MRNTITGLIPHIYDAVDIVSRELVGFIPSVYKNAAAEQVALNQNITYPIVPAADAVDISPSNILPELPDTEYGHGTMAVTKARAHRFHWTGDDQASLERGTKDELSQGKRAQGFRVLANEIEADLAALYTKASRAYGTPGTTPFATAGDFTDASEIARILKDNGAPTSAMRLVINTAAGAQIIGKQSQVHMVGATDPLRRGVLLDIAGLKIRESAQVRQHVAGTGSDSLVNNADGIAVGSTAIAADTGTGTIISGDIVSFAADNGSKYVVSGELAGGSFSVAAPGSRVDIPDNNAITLGGGYAANMAFTSDAIHLLARLPKRPEEGDMADDIMVVQDPVSGLFFEVAVYPAYRAVIIEISIAWGVKAAKPEHMALLLG